MITLTLSTIANVLNGELFGQDISVQNITIDTRTLKTADLFLALKGPTFDGHNFIKKAEQLGCSSLIVDHKTDSDLPQIIVEDTHKALGEIAAYVKKVVNPKTVAITGSSGKTTVKEMTTAILSTMGKVLATKGNFNNDIGVPLTLLSIEPKHEFAVIELGANHAGEIEYTTKLAQPNIALINNIAAAHIEGFGSLPGVAKAKGEIFEGLSDDGIALYNQECKFSENFEWRLKNKTARRFSSVNKADYFSENVMLDENGCARFTLKSPIGDTSITLAIPGKHNVDNALAAASIAIEFGASLSEVKLGLLNMQSVNGRLTVHPLSSTLKVIDDSYNANVDSIKAATALLASFSGTRILILGDMGELGSEAESYHQEVGDYAKTCAIDYLFTIGEYSKATAKAYAQSTELHNHFQSKHALVSALTDVIKHENQQVTLLVKGSRSAKMEEVVQQVIAQHKNNKEVIA